MAHVQKPRFGLSAKRTSPFKSAGGVRLAAQVCASAVVMSCIKEMTMMIMMMMMMIIIIIIILSTVKPIER